MHASGVDDITCGHCVSTVTKALRDAEKNAKINIDWSQRLVKVEAAAHRAVGP